MTKGVLWVWSICVAVALMIGCKRHEENTSPDLRPESKVRESETLSTAAEPSPNVKTNAQGTDFGPGSRGPAGTPATNVSQSAKPAANYLPTNQTFNPP